MDNPLDIMEEEYEYQQDRGHGVDAPFEDIQAKQEETPQENYGGAESHPQYSMSSADSGMQGMHDEQKVAMPSSKPQEAVIPPSGGPITHVVGEKEYNESALRNHGRHLAFMAYHYVVQALRCQPNSASSGYKHSLVLEELQRLLSISRDRHQAEMQAVEANPMFDKIAQVMVKQEQEMAELSQAAASASVSAAVPVPVAVAEPLGEETDEATDDEEFARVAAAKKQRKPRQRSIIDEDEDSDERAQRKAGKGKGTRGGRGGGAAGRGGKPSRGGGTGRGGAAARGGRMSGGSASSAQYAQPMQQQMYQQRAPESDLDIESTEDLERLAEMAAHEQEEIERLNAEIELIDVATTDPALLQTLKGAWDKANRRLTKLIEKVEKAGNE